MCWHTALGATGGNFILGNTNTATTPTSLISTVADAARSALLVQNKSGGSALESRVGNTTTPAKEVATMKVNSNKLVTNLNADLLAGKSATDFYAVGSKVANSIHADQATDARNAADSDELDGKDSGQIGVNGIQQVADASLMDSTDSKSVHATCPDGKIAVGGGARIQGYVRNIALHESHQYFGDPSKWQMSAHEVNPTTDVWRLETYDETSDDVGHRGAGMTAMLVASSAPVSVRPVIDAISEPTAACRRISCKPL